MKGLYLSQNVNKFPGVSKKIVSQIKAFSEYGINMDRIELDVDGRESLLLRVLNRFFFINTRKKFTYSDKLKNYDFVYIRKPTLDIFFLIFLKRIKTNSNVIFLEVPTFPYDKEILKRIFDYPILLKDRLTRSLLHRYIDRIVTYSNDTSIFNIPTINISNGIDCSSLKNRVNFAETNDIHVISVANYNYWHGYDRFINGLQEYYQEKRNRNIIYHIVGDGSSILHYKNLVKEFKLTDKIVFCGPKTGKELDYIYEKCNIALDAMGRHRSEVYYNSSLKGKEYLGKGMPVVSGVTTELDFYTDFKYYFRVPADESNVDIHNIIDFFDKCYPVNDSTEKISDDIRRFAEREFSMKKCIYPIISFIEYSKGKLNEK